MSGSRIVADVGGTNVRFAAARDAELLEVRSYPSREFATFVEALACYLAGTRQEVGEGIAIGAAGPVDGGRVQLTNADWMLEESVVSRSFGGRPVRLINDVEAVAHALPALGPGDVAAIGAGARGTSARRAMLAVNVGTGFGAAAVVPAGAMWVAVPGEAGHMSLAHSEARSVEDLLSGSGLNACYARRNPAHPQSRGAAGLFADCATHATARTLVEDFGGVLGRVAGDLVLAAGAWGGAYFCGSVIDAWRSIGCPGPFRAEFESKGAMSARMASVVTAAILRPNVALAGLARVPLHSAV